MQLHKKALLPELLLTICRLTHQVWSRRWSIWTGGCCDAMTKMARFARLSLRVSYVTARGVGGAQAWRPMGC
jgi:hypothetical protein